MQVACVCCGSMTIQTEQVEQLVVLGSSWWRQPQESLLLCLLRTQTFAAAPLLRAGRCWLLLGEVHVLCHIMLRSATTPCSTLPGKPPTLSMIS